MGGAGPNNHSSRRTPGAGAGTQAADSAEGRDQSRPERGARAARPFVKLSAGTRDSRRDAGATVGIGAASICGAGGGLHDWSSGSSGSRSRIASSASVVGDEITYWPLAHLPRSMRRQRSLQNGKSESVFLTDFLQMGQRSLTIRLRGIRFGLSSEIATKFSPPDRNRVLR
jgi:hypothetical protein